MIVLRKIKFQNWGPFLGDSNDTNVIESLSQEQNFIFAATNTGKSTIMNGLRWLLMNKIDEKEAKITTDYKCKDCRLYFNKDALENDDFIFSVTASFFDDRSRQNIQLVRKVQLNDKFLSDYKKNPELSKYDFLCQKTSQEYDNYTVVNRCNVFFTDENNNAIDEENEVNIDDFLKNFFPSDLANFYFLTGKNLEEVKSTATMDQEMESVLGLSKLALLKKVLNNMSKKQQKILSDKKTQNQLQQDTKIAIQELDNKIQGKETSINKNNELIKEISSKKQIIETQLEHYPENIRELLADRKEIKSKIGELERHINNIKTDALKNYFKNVWKGLIYRNYQSEKTTGLNDDEQELIRSLKALRINGSAEFNTGLFDSKKIGNDLANIVDNYYDEIKESSSNREFANYRHSVENFIDQFKSFDEFLDDKNKKEYKLETINNKIGSISDKDGDNLSLQLESLDKQTKKINDLKALNDTHKVDITKYERDRRIEENKLSNFKIDSTDTDAVKDKIISDIIRCVDSAMLASKEASHSLFQKYVNEFHDKLKDPIRNENYSIKIDKSYEYMIMESRHGKLDPILNPTGSEDVYARVSLNLALVKIAVHKFPMFLDNPIEQLNDKGKERLTRIFENLERQLIIILFDEKGSNNFWQSPTLIQKFYGKSKSYSLSNDSENTKKTNIKSLNL